MNKYNYLLYKDRDGKGFLDFDNFNFGKRFADFDVSNEYKEKINKIFTKNIDLYVLKQKLTQIGFYDNLSHIENELGPVWSSFSGYNKALSLIIKYENEGLLSKLDSDYLKYDLNLSHPINMRFEVKKEEKDNLHKVYQFEIIKSNSYLNQIINFPDIDYQKDFIQVHINRKEVRKGFEANPLNIPIKYIYSSLYSFLNKNKIKDGYIFGISFLVDIFYKNIPMLVSNLSSDIIVRLATTTNHFIRQEHDTHKKISHKYNPFLHTKLGIISVKDFVEFYENHN